LPQREPFMKALLRLLGISSPKTVGTRRDVPATRHRWQPALECLEHRLLPSVSVLTSNFNGTPIQAGTSIWFNSVLKVSGLGASPVTLNVVNGTIDFTANGSAFHVNVPNASITFSPTATTATTRFDVPTNTWITNVPSNLGGNVFLAGVALPVVTKLP